MLPRDCDGGMCKECGEPHDMQPDEVVSIVTDEPDNCARIARDVSDCANRLRAIADKYGPNSIMQRYNVGVLVAVSEQLETM